jgi:hypothetical protein
MFLELSTSKIKYMLKTSPRLATKTGANAFILWVKVEQNPKIAQNDQSL